MLQHTGSFVAACRLLVAASGIWFSDQDLNPGPLCWSLNHWTSREVLRSLVPVVLLYILIMAFCEEGRTCA